MAKDVKFSFLTAGPQLNVRLADDFESLPELSSPLTLNNGFGARSFDFVPTARDTGIGDAHRLLGTLSDRNGRTVELYERLEEPAQWYIRWILRNGFLYTHLREEDGPEKAETVVASLGIVEGANGGAPFLLPDAPLGRGVSAQPGYQEFASFRSTSRNWAIVLQRPSFIAQGKLMRMPESARAVIRAGAPHGVEVTVLSGEDVTGGTALAKEVAGSLSHG